MSEYTPFTSLQIPSGQWRASNIYKPQIPEGFTPADRSIPLDRQIFVFWWNPKNHAFGYAAVQWHNKEFNSGGQTHLTGYWIAHPYEDGSQFNPYFEILAWKEISAEPFVWDAIRHLSQWLSVKPDRDQA